MTLPRWMTTTRTTSWRWVASVPAWSLIGSACALLGHDMRTQDPLPTLTGIRRRAWMTSSTTRVNTCTTPLT